MAILISMHMLCAPVFLELISENPLQIFYRYSERGKISWRFPEACEDLMQTKINAFCCKQVVLDVKKVWQKSMQPFPKNTDLRSNTSTGNFLVKSTLTLKGCSFSVT